MKALNLADYPRFAGENDDAPRINRAIADAPDGQVYIPNGHYYLASSISIRNGCSLEMQELAVLEAIAELDFVIDWNGKSSGETFLSMVRKSRNRFIKGGTIDARGLGSCLHLTNYWHFVLRDITLLNGKNYGLQVGDIGDVPGGDDFGKKPENMGVELMADNLYFQCNMEGLAGNVALNTNHTDSHYTNLVIVDYTIGVMDLCGGSNRYTRVHVWVGALPEYVTNSICYVLKGYTPDYGEIYLESCYADTGEIGFDLYTHVRMVGCAYFNNYSLTKLDHTTCVRNNSQKPVLIADSIFTKMSPNAIFYSGVTGEQVTLRDNIFRGQFDDLKE